MKSIRDFGVLPENVADVNKTNLRAAIDWASPRGAALYVEPDAEPYRLTGGVILKMNASLIGAHGPVGRGTRHSSKAQPVGSVFATDDLGEPLLIVEHATQVRGIQFWYPKQTLSDPEKIIAYPPTIQASRTNSAQGVTPFGAHVLRRVHRDGFQLLAERDLRAAGDRALSWVSALGRVRADRPLLRRPAHPALSREPCEHALLRERVFKEGGRRCRGTRDIRVRDRSHRQRAGDRCVHVRHGRRDPARRRELRAAHQL